jgi:polysaccharide pyruvyl transferase CsaB
MARSPRILISGWYGNGNLGDEAVLAGMLAGLREALPEARVTVLSDDPAATRAEHGVAARGRDKRGPRRRLLSEIRAIARSDVLAIGGGGLVKDFGSHGGNVHAWVRPGLAAHALRRRSLWYAMGVDDVRLPESAAVARRAAERLDLLTVRDEGSARQLRELGVEREIVVTSDPALLLGRPPGDREPAPLRVAVCPREWKAGAAEVEDEALQMRLFDELAAALDGLVHDAGAEVLLVPFQTAGEGDDAVCRAIHGRMAERAAARVCERPASATDAARLLARCSLVVGTRLHSLILAAASGTPFFALDYMPKVRFFAARAGLPGERAGLEAARERGRLAELLGSALARRERTRERLERVAPGLRELARLNAEMLAALASDRGRLPALIEEAKTLDARVRASHEPSTVRSRR